MGGGGGIIKQTKQTSLFVRITFSSFDLIYVTCMGCPCFFFFWATLYKEGRTQRGGGTIAPPPINFRSIFFLHSDFIFSNSFIS